MIESSIRNIRHAGLVVRDMSRSLEFYRDLLGFTVRKDQIESGEYISRLLSLDNAKIRTVKLRAVAGDGLIELLQFLSHPSAGPTGQKISSIGPTHVAFTVLHLDETCRKLIAHGVPFLSLPQRSPDGRALVAFCRDPDGILLELVEELTS